MTALTTQKFRALELKVLMELWFGDQREIGPHNFLLSHGFTLDPPFEYKKPTPSYRMSVDEELCVAFLVLFWDFDGVEGELLKLQAIPYNVSGHFL